MNPPQVSRTAANPRENRRDESLDIAKGFGILLVVVGHCLDGLIAGGFFRAPLAWPGLTVYIIYLFHMPLFFVVSGHLASGKLRPAGATIAKLIPTIVYPYFLWSVLEGLSLVYLSRYTNSHNSMSAIFRIPWIPIIPYWFLYALFCCHLGYLAIRRLPHGVQLAIASVVFLVPQFFLPILFRDHLIIVPETVRGFLYFILGVISVSQVKQFGRWMAITATVLFILFAIVFYQSQLSGIIAAPAALPAGIAGIVAALSWARMLAERTGRFASFFASKLAFWGRYSMSIYVMHIFFTAGVRIALKRVPMVSAYPTALASIVEIGAATAAGIFVPLGLNWMVSKFDLDKWFGLQHMEAA